MSATTGRRSRSSFPPSVTSRPSWPARDWRWTTCAWTTPKTPARGPPSWRAPFGGIVHRAWWNVRRWEAEVGVAVEIREDDRFLVSREAFAGWAGRQRSGQPLELRRRQPQAVACRRTAAGPRRRHGRRGDGRGSGIGRTPVRGPLRRPRSLRLGRGSDRRSAGAGGFRAAPAAPLRRLSGCHEVWSAIPLPLGAVALPQCRPVAAARSLPAGRPRPPGCGERQSAHRFPDADAAGIVIVRRRPTMDQGRGQKAEPS